MSGELEKNSLLGITGSVGSRGVLFIALLRGLGGTPLGLGAEGLLSASTLNRTNFLVKLMNSSRGNG